MMINPIPTLPVLPHTWGATHAPEVYIAKAEIAIMRDGYVQLVTGPDPYGKPGYALMGIEYAGHDSLHYDHDSTVSPMALEEMLETGEADITNDWSIVEKYLVKWEQEMHEKHEARMKLNSGRRPNDDDFDAGILEPADNPNPTGPDFFYL